MKRWLLIICILMSISFYIAYENHKKVPDELLPSDYNEEETYIPLKMFVIGEEPLDFNKVLEKANSILGEQIEVNLTVEFINPKNVASDYHTIFAGGADFDLIQVYPYHYNLYASRAAYMNLTEDMLKKCIPTTFQELNTTFLNQVRIGKMLYMIPSDAYLENQQVMLLRGDILRNTGIREIHTIKDLENYFLQVNDNYSQMVPLDIGYNGYNLLKFLYLQPNSIEIYDDYLLTIDSKSEDEQIKWFPQETGFTDYYKTIKDWREKGFIPENASSKKIVTSENFIAGKTGAYIGDIYEIENLKRIIEKTKPEYEPTIVTLGSPINQVRYPLDHGIAIKNGSQYAAKSLMFIEQLRKNKELFRLLNYGIEGLHYRVSEKGNYIPLTESYRYPIYNNFIWCMSNEFKLSYEFSIQSYNEQKIRITKKHKAVSMKDPLLDLAHIEKVNKNTLYPLTLGYWHNDGNEIQNYLELMEKENFRIYKDTVLKAIQTSTGR